MTELVSIIIPVYKVEQYLRRCLDSVINQSYQNIEIIIVNDGSPDNSQTIIDEYARNDARITSVLQRNQGVGSARNSGMNLAGGKYLMFIDPDDYVESNCVELLLNNAQNTNADIIVANHKRLIGQVLSCESKLVCRILDEQSMKNVHWRFDYFIDRAFGITVWAKLYRFDFIKKTGIQFESNELISGEDMLFNLKLYTFNPKISVFDEYIYVYFCNEESITQSFKPRLSQRYVTFMENFMSHLKEEDQVQNYQDILAFLTSRFISASCYNAYKYSNHRYAAIKKELKYYVQSDIIRGAITDIANGRYFNDTNKTGKIFSRLQAYLLRLNLIDVIVILRLIRSRFESNRLAV